MSPHGTRTDDGEQPPMPRTNKLLLLVLWYSRCFRLHLIYLARKGDSLTNKLITSPTQGTGAGPAILSYHPSTRRSASCRTDDSESPPLRHLPA